MKDIEKFYSSFSNDLRVLIDKLSGSIFEIFPIIKEKINFKTDSLEYIDSKYGKFIILRVKENSVELIIKKKNKILMALEFFDEKDIDMNKLEVGLKVLISENF